jgi:hypothetical protein
MPSYSIFKHPQMQNVMEKYYNTILLQKKVKYFDYYQKIGNFSDKQLVTITRSAIDIKLGFINREIAVINVGQKILEG